MISGASAMSSRLLCSVANALGHLRCPKRAESELAAAGPSSAEQFVSLPECVQAQVLEFAGVKGASSLGLACSALRREAWDSAEVWRARLASSASSAVAVIADSGSVESIRDQYRWKHYGLDALCSWRVLGGPNQDHADAEHPQLVQSARRAVSGLMPTDVDHLDIVVDALVDLLGWYNATDDKLHESADELVRYAAARTDIFSVCHEQRLSIALEDAVAVRSMLAEALNESLGELAEVLDDFPATSQDLDEPIMELLVDNREHAEVGFQLTSACLWNNDNSPGQTAVSSISEAKLCNSTGPKELAQHCAADEAALDRIIRVLQSL